MRSELNLSVWRGKAFWFVLTLSLLAALAGWRLKPESVDAVTLRTQPLQRTLQFTARVKTPARVDVGSIVTGRVVQVRVQEGDAVQMGQALVDLDASELQATLGQAQATLRQAQARLSSQQGLSLPAAESALAQAQSNVHVAERDVARVRELVAAQFYSPAMLDNSQRTLDVARAQREAAQAQVQANRLQGGEGAGAQAQVLASQAAVDVAKARLDQATLRAPGKGRVLARLVEPGQIVQAGKGLLSLRVDGPLELSAQVDERFLAQLRLGQRARVQADAYPGQPFDATVGRLGPAVDAASGSVEVVLVVAGARPDFLREDMTLSVEVLTGERAAARVLPLRAVKQATGLGADADRGTVMVVQDGHAVAREVKLGLRTLDQAEVLQGVQEGEAVLLDPNVAAGTRVRSKAAP